MAASSSTSKPNEAAPAQKVCAASTDNRNNKSLSVWWLSCWRTFSLEFLPRIRLGGLDFSLTLLTAVVFFGVRSLAGNVLETFGWPSSDPAGAAWIQACSVSLVHSTTLLPGLLAAFFSHGYNPSEQFHAAPQWWQDSVHALLQFCTGYMLFDSVFMLAQGYIFSNDGLSNDDVLFFGHHMATTFYMTATRVVAAGHGSAMMCMFLGEMTNPFHNTFYITQRLLTQPDCCGGSLIQTIYHYDVFAFSALYIVVRLLVGPIICLHMTWHLLTCGRKQQGIPTWLVTIWIVLIWGVILGSIPWIYECWDMLQPYLSTSSSAEEQEL